MKKTDKREKSIKKYCFEGYQGASQRLCVELTENDLRLLLSEGYKINASFETNPKGKRLYVELYRNRKNKDEKLKDDDLSYLMFLDDASELVNFIAAFVGLKNVKIHNESSEIYSKIRGVEIAVEDLFDWEKNEKKREKLIKDDLEKVDIVSEIYIGNEDPEEHTRAKDDLPF